MASRLLSPIQTWEARRALRTARRAADSELVSTRLAPPRLAWRTAELVDHENRVSLGRSLTDVVHAADERLLPSAAPIDRAAVRGCRAQLLELASILFDLDRTVSPRGVLLVDELLSGGPMYGGGGLRAAIERARAAL